MVNPIISFTADVAEPDIYNDVNGLPDPFTMNIILGITNTHTATLYFKASISSPPAAYTSSSTNLGSLAPEASGFFIFTPVRHPPTLTAGEYDETLTLRIDAYTDSGYSSAYANQTLSTNVHHFDHAEASWTVVDHTSFDDGGVNGWITPYPPVTVVDESRANAPFNYVQNTIFYSSPYSYTISGGVYGRYNEKTINTNGYTKARFIIHVKENGAEFALRINNILVKPFGIMLPVNIWTRLAFNMPIGSAVVCKFAGNSMNDHVYVDEIWVIAK